MALVSKIGATGRPQLHEGRKIPRLENLMAVLSLQLPISRFRLLDIVENLQKDPSTTLDIQSLDVVAKENLHVRVKVLANLMLIGSCTGGSQPKHVFHKCHWAAVFAEKRYDLSHKSIVVNPKSETATKKRQIWQLKRKIVKRAFKA